MAWRIEVDRDLCQGHGVCESEAPDVFEVPGKDQVVVVDAAPSDAQRRAVEQAIRYCPTRALRIIED